MTTDRLRLSNFRYRLAPCLSFEKTSSFSHELLANYLICKPGITVHDSNKMQFHSDSNLGGAYSKFNLLTIRRGAYSRQGTNFK